MLTPRTSLRTDQPDATRRETLADQVLRRAFITHEAQNEPVHPHMVPCEQHLHGEPVARSNSSDQDLVGCRLHRALTVGSRISRVGRYFGSTIGDGPLGAASPRI